MKYMYYFIFILFLKSLTISAQSQNNKLIGIKFYPDNESYRELYFNNEDLLIKQVRSSGLNSLFITPYSGNRSFYNSSMFTSKDTSIDLSKIRAICKKNKIKFGLICQIFFSPDISETDTNLLPVDDNGSSKFDNWQKLVCPSDTAFIKKRKNIIKELVKRFNPDFINLDFMRYPLFWEGIKPYSSPDTFRNYCFCERCIKLFSKDCGIIIPKYRTAAEAAAYINNNFPSLFAGFKVKQISSVAQEFYNTIKKLSPSVKVIIHTIPWDSVKYKNAIKNIAGQDIKQLLNFTDGFSPMIYNYMIEENTDYIGKLIRYIHSQTKKSIFPSVQLTPSPNKNFSDIEFDEILKNSFNPFSAGVLFFHWGSLYNKKCPDGNQDLILQLRKFIFAGSKQ